MWALPTGRLEEDRAKLVLSLGEWRQPQLARTFHRLQRMDDVVDLSIVLCAAGLKVAVAEDVRIEAVEILLAEVEARVAIDHQLGDRLRRSRPVRQPDCLARPKAADVE